MAMNEKGLFHRFYLGRKKDKSKKAKDDADREERDTAAFRTDATSSMDSAPMAKAIGYTGPLTQEEILIRSWDDFFAEGGNLNQPSWLATDRLARLKRGYEKLTTLHRS